MTDIMPATTLPRTATAAPATPSRCVPDGRKLTTTNRSLRDAIAGSFGKAVTTFALAEIEVLRADAGSRGEEQMFDNEGEHVLDKPWQTFWNLVADEPDKAVTQPITVTTDVKMALTVLFVGVADLVNKVGKLPAEDPLGLLASVDWREASIVRLMLASTTRAHHCLGRDPLCRELDYPHIFRQKFEALVDSKAFVDPGVDAISRLFLDFIKIVAWHAAVRAYENGRRLTINRVTFFSIVASMEAGLSEKEVPVVRDVLYLMRTQIQSWEISVARAKAKKSSAKKSSAKKSSAKKSSAKKSSAKKSSAKKSSAKKSERSPAPAAEVFDPATPKQPAVVSKVSMPELEYDALLTEIDNGV